MKKLLPILMAILLLVGCSAPAESGSYLQINMSDALGLEGETWRVSTCWPSTAVLLGMLESPENTEEMK